MNSTTPENQGDEPEEAREESLAERSARLEAEAAAKYDASYDMDGDPLAPSDIDPADIDEPASDDVRIEALQDELDKAKDQLLRTAAEAENVRKRARKEREDASRFAISGFAKDLLDVADNLRRALDAVPEDLAADERVKTFVDGIEATERAMLRTFEKNGIEKLEPLDEPFDPNFHEVMFEGPAPDKAPGTIIQVVETGYVLNGRILRPARVGVAQAGGSAESPEPPATEPGGSIDTEV